MTDETNDDLETISHGRCDVCGRSHQLVEGRPCPVKTSCPGGERTEAGRCSACKGAWHGLTPEALRRLMSPR